jgi:hypothetical protein
MKKENPKVQVVKDKENNINIKIMEQAIVDVAEAARKLLNSRLSKRAVIVLIRDSMPGSGMPFKDIETVLDCAARLDKSYLKL